MKENPNEITYCPDCYILMQPLSITSDEWKSKTDIEKQHFKESLNEQKILQGSNLTDTAMAADINIISEKIKSMAADIHFMKTVLLL